RGVEVCVILPKCNNLPFVSWASRHGLDRLLDRGVKIYFQPPPFAHSKLFIVDEGYGMIGSANWDPRSLRLNFELGVELYDREAVHELAAHIEHIRNSSQEFSLKHYHERPLYKR